MDEQRAPNTVSFEPGPVALKGDALRAEIDRLSAELAAEEAALAAAELQASPPRPVDEIAIDLLDAISSRFGHHPQIDALVAEMKRALGK